MAGCFYGAGLRRLRLARLAALGDYAFNLVPGETVAFASDRWLDAYSFSPALAERARGGRSGDVYARLA